MQFIRIKYYPFIKEKENISSILLGFLFSLVTIPPCVRIDVASMNSHQPYWGEVKTCSESLSSKT